MLSKQDYREFAGDMRQFAGVRMSTLNDGKSDGTRAAFLHNDTGLDLTVLPGRGLDIADARFKGRSLTHLSGTGITSPAYFEEPGLGWLGSYYVGLLDTCGISYSGAPSEDNGEVLGLHGRINNSGAENLSLFQDWEGDEYKIRIAGTVREAKTMYTNLAMHRTIETTIGQKGFTIHDRVENLGFEDQPLMMLYHINFGYPLVGPTAEMAGPIRKTVPRDKEAERDDGVNTCHSFCRPVKGYREKVYFHELAADKDGNTTIGILNRDTGDGTPLGVTISYNQHQLPKLTQWKMMAKGCYVCGLEPATALPLGRAEIRKRKELIMLPGQESYDIDMRISILDSHEELDEYREHVKFYSGRATGLR